MTPVTASNQSKFRQIHVNNKKKTRLVALQKLLIDTCFVIKVIISYNTFIAIDPMKKCGARFSFFDFHGQKFSQQQEPSLREKITENMINI